jgi:aryl-alcohol dehydrogenase-like predicted oxidoreductase
VDRLDLYWLHYDNPAYPVSHFIDFLNEQADAGRIRYFACSNWPAARIRDANAYAAAHKLRSFVANQMWWSLAKPDLSKYPDPTACGMDDATWELHCRTGLTAIPYSPQAKGFFNKLDERGVEGLDEFSTRMFASPENVAKLPRLKEVAAQADATIAQVALAWMLHQPFPTFPIVGCSRREQLVDSVKATGVKLTPEMIRKLE